MKWIIAACAAATLAMPATANERCLIADQIDGFSDASRDGVTLSSHGRDYRVEVMGPCNGLNFANDVVTVSATSCFEAGDKIKFSDGSGIPQTCVAKSVTLIEKDAPKAPPAP